jgi:D-alanyl-lipoteichoic acid acyltransferase DltB (MBOAT superfamily)
VVGLAKKLLIADQLAYSADLIFALNAHGEVDAPMAWFGALAFALQLFFDFSGYSDMALGLGRMFGFHFAENFNYPFIAKSLGEFWQRWHISLGGFFRDYVYFPMGGSRVSKTRWVWNSFVMWTLIGLWHGAHWNFVLWGWFQLALVLLERFTGYGKWSQLPNHSWAAKILRHAYIPLFFLLAVPLFRAGNGELALSYYQKMFAGGFDVPFRVGVQWASLVFGILFCMPLVPTLRNRLGKTLAWRVAEPAVMLGLLVLCLITSTASNWQPFIYFNF